MEYSSIIRFVQGDTVLYFNTIEDCNRYKELHSSPGSMLVPRYGEGELVEIVATETKNMVWIGYHSLTPSWSKTSIYRCDKSTLCSANGSYKWDNFTFNLGFLYRSTLTITYPADNNRWSKLGCWGDFYFEKHKVIETSYGKPTGKIYYIGIKKTLNHYIAVVY